MLYELVAGDWTEKKNILKRLRDEGRLEGLLLLEEQEDLILQGTAGRMRFRESDRGIYIENFKGEPLILISSQDALQAFLLDFLYAGADR